MHLDLYTVAVIIEYCSEGMMPCSVIPLPLITAYTVLGDSDKLADNGVSPLDTSQVMQYRDTYRRVEDIAAKRQCDRIAAEGFMSQRVPGNLQGRWHGTARRLHFGV